MQRYQESVISAYGRPVVGATVRVTTLAGADATIYSDNGVTPITSLVTDSTGVFGFYAADGRYNITISGAGFPTKVIADVLFEDPSDGSAALAASGGSALIGFLQSGSGMVPRSVQSKQREVLSATDAGADNAGILDCSTALVAVTTEGKNSNRPVTLNGGSYHLSASVLLPYHVNVDFGNATVDATSLGAATWAITAKNTSGATNLQRQSTWKGLRLNVATGGYGLKVEAPTGQWAVSGFRLADLYVKGGAIGVGFGENTWLVDFDNAQISGQTSIGVDGRLGTNSGEGMQFRSCVIAGVVSGSLTGRGFKSDLLVSSGSWKFFGTSFDYSDVQIEHTDGNCELHGCHVEANAAAPMVLVTQVGGRAQLNFDAFGTWWVHPVARAANPIIQVSGNAIVNIKGGQCNALASTEALEFVSVPSSSDNPAIDIRGVNFGLFPGISTAIGRVCGYTSLVRNGDFENATALAGWGMDAVNFIRNGAFVNASAASGTIGSGGTATMPSNMNVIGSGTNLGLTMTQTVTYNGSTPVYQLAITGTPNATGSVGIYLDNTNAIASKQGDIWKHGLYARNITSGAVAGINFNSLAIQERDSGGTATVANSQSFTLDFKMRGKAEWSYTVQNAATAYIQPSLQFGVTSGVPVNLSIEVDNPYLVLGLMDTTSPPPMRRDTAATLPTYRVQLDSANGRTAAKAMKLYSTAAETVGVYSTIPLKARDWLIARGYANITAVTAGGAGLQVSWRDASGNEISNQNVRGSYLTAAGVGYVQHSGVRVAPQGTEHARLMAYLSGFNGTVLFDDIEAWVQ